MAVGRGSKLCISTGGGLLCFMTVDNEESWLYEWFRMDDEIGRMIIHNSEELNNYSLITQNNANIKTNHPM